MLTKSWTDKEGVNKDRILVVAEHVESKPDPNFTSKTEQTEELDVLDQEIAFRSILTQHCSCIRYELFIKTHVFQQTDCISCL